MTIRSGFWCIAILAAMASPAHAQTSGEESPEGKPPGGPSDAGAQPALESTEGDRVTDAKRSSARQLATEASLDYRTRDFAAAYDKFNRAYHLVGIPSLGLWSARSLRELGRLVEAAERYREITRAGAGPDAPAAHLAAIRDAEAELEELKPKIPNLIIKLRDANIEDVSITLDGVEVDSALIGVKQTVDPGKHEIVGTREGEVVEQSITLRERQTEELVLGFRPGYQKKASTQDPESGSQTGMRPVQAAGIVLMGVGGASLIGGVITTIVALGQQSDLRDNCNEEGECPPEFHDQVNQFGTMKVLSTATLIGGAVLGGVGLGLYLGGRPKKEGVALHLHGQGVTFRGAF